MKRSNDYDSVFKTMKLKTKRLFIPVINNIFGRNYDYNEEVTILSSECADLRESTDGTSLESHLKESDYRIRIEQSTYLLECQSYDDDIEERMVKIMGGGVVLETLYEKVIREGTAIGIEQGLSKGEELDLIRQIIYNKLKGRNVSQITDFLDADPDTIMTIYNAIENDCDTDPEKIYQKLHR